MKKILKQCSKKNKQLIAITVLFITLASIAEICQPVIFVEIGERIGIFSNPFSTPSQEDEAFVETIYWSLALLALVLVGSFFHLIAIKLLSKASTSIALDLRMKVFNKSIALSADKINELSVSSLVVRTTNDINQIREAIYNLFSLAIRAPLFVIMGLIAILVQIDSLTTGLAGLDGSEYTLAIAFLMIPLAFPIVFIIIATAVKKLKLQRDYLDQNNQIMLDNLVGNRVIRIFNLEQLQENKFGVVNNNLRKVSKFSEARLALLFPVIMFVYNLANFLIQLIYGFLIVKLYSSDDPTNGIQLQLLVSTFSQYFGMVLMGIIFLASSLAIITRAFPSAKRYWEVLDSKSSIQSGTSDKKIEKGEIEFKNVSFKYSSNLGSDKTVNTLENINFKIGAGEILGIIGSTGSGKTTLASLVSRIYDPTEGEVLIDGINVRQYHLDNLKEAVSVAFQDKILFRGTIESNIRVGRINATQQEILEASKNAEAYEFIVEKEKQFQDIVEQGGSNLSGGQKQRLSIARALIRKPKILVFDDSLSALDNITEAKLLNNIKKNLNNTTLVIVAQRVKSIQNANKILVLDDGKISGFGTHEELLRNNKLYEQIYESQRTSIGE